MKKDAFYRILGVFLLAVILLLMVTAFVGCRTVDITKSRSTVDSTAVQVNSTDSSSYNLFEMLLKYGRTTEREFTPGRDTTIIYNGEVKVIQLPGQLVRETIRETGEQSTKEEDSKSFSHSDSAIVELLKNQSQKDKETSGIPVYVWIIGAGIGLLLIKDFIPKRK